MSLVLVVAAVLSLEDEKSGGIFLFCRSWFTFSIRLADSIDDAVTVKAPRKILVNPVRTSAAIKNILRYFI